MPQMTPIQESFSAGEISPLMFQRSQTEGYQQGLAELTNMFADSRGPAFSRSGSKYIGKTTGNDARIMAIPVNDSFFYSGIFTDKKLTISGLVGHNPNKSYGSDPHFTEGGAGWSSDTDGNITSSVVFLSHEAHLHVDDKNSRYALVSQQITVPSVGNYRVFWSTTGFLPLTLKVGTSSDNGSIHQQTLNSYDNNVIVNFTSLSLWVTMRLDSSNSDERDAHIDYLGVGDENPAEVSFVTPYFEHEVASLQGIQSPSGGDLYILHEFHPPHKLSYDVSSDAFSWDEVVFTSPPAKWVAGSYPSAGDFFEGRLWLGGAPNDPQTFWASKSGLPENFDVGTGLADESLEFTMAKYGRIKWMVGFKNLVIGTQNSEHIVTSVGGLIKPDDVQVEQQSSYGSINVQPVQVGDQIFYVSADGLKLRAIQYEWQKDNWLSKDLTFNSEHITRAGIRHITWQQNPKNLFHCVLNDGTVASLTYERGHNVYGWSKLEWAKGRVLDATTGPIDGTDLANIIIQNKIGEMNFETQTQHGVVNYLDSWVDGNLEPDGLTVTGLDHLEGFEAQILTNGAAHPNRTVVSGQITLQRVYSVNDSIIVGLQFNPRLTTLPFDQGAPAGSGASWQKRWNKIFIRVLNSTMPKINGERAPERHPSTPMGDPQPPVNEEILRVNLGFSKHSTITIEQDLPYGLTVLGVFGELSQSKL